jgi:peptidoglycan lytic transglycosylase
MSFIDCAVNPDVDTETNDLDASLASAGFRNLFRLVPVALAAISVGACNQYTVATNKSGLHAVSRQALPEENREAPVGTVRHVAVRRVKHTPFKRPVETQFASRGIASFYTEEQQTANGEKFNPNALTAAHKTLPFGTRLRVTNVATGRSVTVRINDRGPYIPGRIVDVSYSAAESLGIVGRGVAKVKLDVVH